MTSATAGDMVFDEEPTVDTPEEMHAGSTGMEAAAYCPRGGRSIAVNLREEL